jgi:transketolase|tara:strand:+ start:1199 stop:1810 length:612 start_codon:yes stop_codon:yes gene_type:complete
MVDLKKRILEIAHKHKLSHLGSYLTAVDIIDEIYRIKNPNDIFILSSGHAALALYVVIEKYEGKNAEELFLKHGGHPHRDEKNGIYCSTGSLGLGITIAVGRALANKNRKVHVLISDGESAEGSVWEALRFIKENNLPNIEIYVNVNGYAAYDKVDVKYLVDRLKVFLPSINIKYTSVNQYPFLRGLNAHYHVMSEKDYKSTL